ncbi:hypothetical protein RFI_13067, partial [Reticulomyxa filosa]
MILTSRKQNTSRIENVKKKLANKEIMTKFDANEFEETEEDILRPTSSIPEEEDVSHFREKMMTMEAEAQKIMELSRRMEETGPKHSDNSADDNDNGDPNTNNASKKSQSQKQTPTSAQNQNPSQNQKQNKNQNQSKSKFPNDSPSGPAVQAQGTISSPIITTTNLTTPTDHNNADPSAIANASSISEKEDQKALDERSVFVKNVRAGFIFFFEQIDKQLNVDQVKEYFEACGAVERVTLLANKFTGEPKGCAYIQFRSKVAVANALLLNSKAWQGKTIE